MPARTVELEHVWQLRARKSVSSNLGDVLGAVQVAVRRVSGRASRVRSRRDSQTTGKDDSSVVPARARSPAARKPGLRPEPGGLQRAGLCLGFACREARA